MLEVNGTSLSNYIYFRHFYTYITSIANIRPTFTYLLTRTPLLPTHFVLLCLPYFCKTLP